MDYGLLIMVVHSRLKTSNPFVASDGKYIAKASSSENLTLNVAHSRIELLFQE